MGRPNYSFQKRAKELEKKKKKEAKRQRKLEKAAAAEGDPVAVAVEQADSDSIASDVVESATEPAETPTAELEPEKEANN